jgi:CDP-diacylglycerol--serine O-phosphatidyltransferase
MAYLVKNGWIEGKQSLPFGTMTLWGQPGGIGELHVASGIFFVWGAAMVSKTLRVPKL